MTSANDLPLTEGEVEAVARMFAIADTSGEAISVYADDAIWREDWEHFRTRKAMGYGSGLRVALYEKFARAILTAPSSPVATWREKAAAYDKLKGSEDGTER